MDSRLNLGRRLIVCGTIIVVAALILVGCEMGLSAEDIRDHRAQSSSLLRSGGVDRVTLSQWEPPSIFIAWVAMLGGFALIGNGIRVASKGPIGFKEPRRDDLD
jgi:hypothetical protein